MKGDIVEVDCYLLDIKGEFEIVADMNDCSNYHYMKAISFAARDVKINARCQNGVWIGFEDVKKMIKKGPRWWDRNKP